MNGSFLRPGQVFDFRGERYTVTKTNPKNYKIVSNADGKHYNLNRNATGITPVEDGSPRVTYRELAAEAEITLHPGTAVKFVNGPGSVRWPGVYVVMRAISPGRVSVAKLGGDNGMYVKANVSSLVKVDAINSLQGS